MTSDHLIFMYGTLKAKQPNNHYLYDADREGVSFVGHALTEERYPLIITTDNNIPFLLLHDGTVGNQIVGEVYRVNDTTMEFLDKFEGYPMVYNRKKVNVTVQPNKSEAASEPHSLTCWLYGLSRFKAKFLEQPHYREYLSDGDHNRPFIPIAPDSKLEDLKTILFDD